MNEGGGMLLNNACGGSVPLVGNQVTAWNGGPYGCVVTPSSEAFVAVADNTPLDITGSQITLGVYVYPTALATYKTLIAKVNSVSARQYGLYLVQSDATKLYLNLNGVTTFGSGGAPVTISPIVTLNAWNHIVVTYDGANARSYINGKLANTTACTGNITHSTGSMMLCGENNGNSFNLTGSMDRAFVYNRTLSAAEIAADYANPFAMFAPANDRRWMMGIAAAPSSGGYNGGGIGISPRGMGIGI